ncbi:phosphate signaling complex protein PhoU [Lentilactobacillus kefiri]|jgi:phosphate transport system protein|uniref:Phosphate-specific transport system accessory protein PhoU n=2 Tax=Lentilactobacillus kefiri TaxID=33962 RepID=A0A8E1V1P2_LENKE|nr:phosphate signaling complex protein PhoU [Lentilactobacillus kefiri]KRL72355.1 phosphate uptake regulator PhoU [Lentilactobacillus parakefiri DSM 10551]KRM53877.1 phosphate uptake regulator PhoU [Lentilactobacillus kefiri DSM 20587 = JCM 5818]MCP9369331.1 phosphate signaling complex protein PhoU [Lentilactobacillus kefiri]MDH5109076.1 phosphate signaling complex protein PhoU [Lentilactobacillus kefiri]MDM7493254.1 phosphate signaling complex protein PhoU [Lentilactobacillus kefiri]
MGKVFDEEIVTLKADFMKLGALVGQAVDNAGQAFIDHDSKKAEAVITNDHDINHLQIYIEKRSFEMIALYQPVTGDLREVVGILKAVTDLERAGDHARNVAKSVIEIKGKERISSVEEIIATMANQVSEQYENSIESYGDADKDKAKQTAQSYDKKIDQLYNDIAAPSYQAMAKDPEIVSSAIIYLNVAKDLGRISDYSTNICEWTVYLATGKIIELN